MLHVIVYCRGAPPLFFQCTCEINEKCWTNLEAAEISFVHSLEGPEALNHLFSDFLFDVQAVALDQLGEGADWSGERQSPVVPIFLDAGGPLLRQL